MTTTPKPRTPPRPRDRDFYENRTGEAPTPKLLMKEALDRVAKAFKNKDCLELFGTHQSRENGWDPREFAKDLFSGKPSDYGWTVFVPLTSAGPVAATVPFGSAGVVPTLGVLVLINSSTGPGDLWMNADTDINAMTLLHELGHAYDILQVRGSGGSAITTPDRTSSTNVQNDALVAKHCLK